MKLREYKTENNEIVMYNEDGIQSWEVYSFGFDRWTQITLTDSMRETDYFQDLEGMLLDKLKEELEEERRDAERHEEYMNGEFKFDSWREDSIQERGE